MPTHRSTKNTTHETAKPTKKEERLNAHDQKQKKLITLGAAIFGGIILLILIIGLIDGYLLTPKKVIASVGEDEITVEQFRSKARFYRWQLLQQSVQIEQILNLFGDYDGNQQNTLSYYNSLLSSDAALGNIVLEGMIEEIIVQRKAEELGITISDAEVQEALQAGFNYYPSGTPTPALIATTAPLPTLNAEQLLLITATPTSEPTNTPQPTEETPEDSDADQEEALPTATPYTAELFDQNFSNYLNELQGADLTEEELFENQRYKLLREAVFDALTAEVPATEEQVWARHILVEDVTEIASILGQLESGEMDFAELAEKYSKDGSAQKGGDLGWFGRGAMVPEFEEVAFSLAVGEISEPVTTDFGFHLIQVIAHDDVPISASRQAQLKDEMFSEWLNAERTAIEDSLVINEGLLASQTPSHPRISDPAVFKALYGVTIRQYNATAGAQVKEITQQAKTLNAMPTTSPTAAE